METDSASSLRAALPLVILGVVVAMVSSGLAHGVWLSNLHNGLLAFAFGGVASWLLLVRPRQREAMLFALVGVIEGVMFLGRQIAHYQPYVASPWWGWVCGPSP